VCACTTSVHSESFKFHVYQFPHIAVMSDVTFAIPESGFKIKIHGVRIRAVSHCTTGLAWMYACTDDSTTFYMIIITSWNRVVPYSRIVFNRQDTGLYGKSLWRRGI
jgi:hypothetical protein